MRRVDAVCRAPPAPGGTVGRSQIGQGAAHGLQRTAAAADDAAVTSLRPKTERLFGSGLSQSYTCRGPAGGGTAARVHSAMLSPDDLAALEAGTFELPCLDMQLRQRGTDAPRVYRGPGRIARDPAGGLTLTLYAPGPLAPEALEERPARLGDTLPPQAYYDLEAHDVLGRTWRSTYVLPSAVLPSTPAVGEEPGAVVTAALDDIEAAAARNRHRERLTLHFNTPVDVPFNARTVTRTAVDGGEGAVVSVRWDVARFDALDRRFEIRPRRHGFVVEVEGTDPAPPGFEYHVVDALRFVLGAVPAVAVAHALAGGVERVTVYAVGQSDATQGLHRPVPGHMVGAEDYTWRLFDRYLRHVCAAGENRHPLSVVWRGVVRAAAGSVETQALVWAVAVEQVVLMRPTSEADEEPPEVHAELVRWADQAREFLRERACPEPVLKRLSGLLDKANQVTKPSPRNALHTLVRRGIVARAQLAAWEHVRNASAHAGFRTADDPAGRSREVLVVLMLLYRLVYDVVGFDGPLADYYSHRG